MFKRCENHGAVCSAWSSLEDEDNPRNRFLSRALLSSSWCQDVVLFLDWRTPATALPGTGVEISHIIRCCLRCGDHGAMVGGGWRGGGTQSAALCLLSLPGAGTLSSVTTVMSAQAVAVAFTWVQRGPKIVIVLSMCLECFMYNSRCGL